MLAGLGLDWADLSASVILGLVVVMILTGWLVPRRTYQDMRESRDHERRRYETLDTRLDLIEEHVRTASIPLLAEASRRGSLPDTPATVVAIQTGPTPARAYPSPEEATGDERSVD